VPKQGHLRCISQTLITHEYLSNERHFINSDDAISPDRLFHHHCTRS